jgi:hypothetical protein
LVVTDTSCSASIAHSDAARERLAAGQAQVGHAHVGQQRDQALDLLEREDLLALEPRQPLGGHAVLAAEVAAVGDRQAHVCDPPAMAVLKWRTLHAPSVASSECESVGDPLRRPPCWPLRWA